MSILEVPAFLLLLIGSGFVLSEVRWFRRAPLATRLAPYRPAGMPRHTSGNAVRAMLLPIAESAGNRLSSALGVKEGLATRLARAGRSESVTEFRLKQFSRTLLALLAALAASFMASPPLLFALAMLIGAPLLAALAPEHRLDTEVAHRRQAIEAELPVITEQLGILLGAGYSLPAALNRLALRSSGAMASELLAVVQDIRRGSGEIQALLNWSTLVDLPSLDGLVSVLALHQEASDLGALISEEAKSIRSDAHRTTIESIERRSQLVWIPVTVATLVPGLILLAVPFVAAMSQVTGA